MSKQQSVYNILAKAQVNQEPVKVEFATNLMDAVKDEVASQFSQMSRIKTQMGGFADDLKKIASRFTQAISTIEDMEVKMKELGITPSSEFSKIKAEAIENKKRAIELTNLSIKARG